MGVRENAALPSNWIGGRKRFSWASRAGAPSPPACLPRAPRSFLRPSYPSVCYVLQATCRLHSQTNLSCTCVSPSSALSVTISLLEAPTSPACICLGARKTDRRLSSECHEHFSQPSANASSISVLVFKTYISLGLKMLFNPPTWLQLVLHLVLSFIF